MNDQQVLDALVAGRALIERPGTWVSGADRVHAWRGGKRGPIRARCAGAACSDALGFGECEFLDPRYGDDQHPEELAVLGTCMNELRLAIPAPWVKANPRSGIVGYNDDPSTTHADIIAVFDTAIGRVRARIEDRRPLAPASRRAASAEAGEPPVPDPPLGTGGNHYLTTSEWSSPPFRYCHHVRGSCTCGWEVKAASHTNAQFLHDQHVHAAHAAQASK